MDNAEENLKELTEKQMKYLSNIDNALNKQADSIIHFIKTSKLKQLKNKVQEVIKYLNTSFKDTNKRLKFSTSILILSSLFIGISYMISNKTKVLTSTNLNTEYTGSILCISMNKESNLLDYKIEKLTVIGADNTYTNINNIDWVNSNINTDSKSYTINNKTYGISKELKLKNIHITNQLCYIQYNNKEDTASKEFIFATSKPSEIDTSNLQKINSRTLEKSNPIQVKTSVTTYNKTFLMLIETLAGGILKEDSLLYTVQNIENTIDNSTKTEENKENIIIKFDELGKLRLNQLIKGDLELIYNSKEDVLKIRDKKENKDYIYISSIENKYIGCSASDLIATTNDNLFIHKDFNQLNSIGYKTFALKTENNLYIFKLNTDSSEELQTNIFEQLGIDVVNNQIEIKKIQRMIEDN